MAKETPTSVQYTITEGDFTVFATISLPSGRITLEKQQQGGGYGNKRDYHFEQSTPEKVEGFAKCALRAVELQKILLKAGVQAGYVEKPKAAKKPKK